MTEVDFKLRLERAWDEQDSLLCVGLDPEPSRLPQCLKGEESPLLSFNKAIIDATAAYACAFKPQIAFYSALGAEAELAATLSYIKSRYPKHIVILDSKRGDIGNTAAWYAKEAFDRYGVDAVTVNPYLGFDSVQPFLSRPDKGAIILCRTSNPGAKDFQDLVADGRPLYAHVAAQAFAWNNLGNVLLVVGATYPAELQTVREIVGSSISFLVPGVGAQGGSAREVVRRAQCPRGKGLIINSSRSILFASSGDDFAEAARVEAHRLRDEINSARMR